MPPCGGKGRGEEVFRAMLVKSVVAWLGVLASSFHIVAPVISAVVLSSVFFASEDSSLSDDHHVC